jgi:hypothetical protein
MQQLHEHHPEDAEAAIFYALALNGAVDFDDKSFTKQLKAAAILNDEGKRQPNHPGIAHYLIHSYDFAPLAAMCVSTAQLYGRIAPNAFHALHMPSHIYSILGMWEDSVRSNLASKTSADDYEAKNFPDTTHPGVPHMSDFLVYADLQMTRDGDARQLVDSLLKLKKFRFASLGTDAALAAIPARFALERGRWDEAALLPVRDSQFPAALSITYFAARSAPPVQGMRRQPRPRSLISTRSRRTSLLPRTTTGRNRLEFRNRQPPHGSRSLRVGTTRPSRRCARPPISTTPARRTFQWRTSWFRSARCWASFISRPA